MNFGDKIRISDILWQELNEFVCTFPDCNLINSFVFVTSSKNNLVTIATEGNVTDCLAITSIGKFTSTFKKYSFWRDYIDITHTSQLTFNDNYQIDSSLMKKYIQNQTLTFDDFPKDQISLLTQNKPDQFGGKCLICKDYNPYMNGDGFCWVCNTDPRNKYKIEDIKEKLVQMASI